MPTQVLALPMLTCDDKYWPYSLKTEVRMRTAISHLISQAQDDVEESQSNFDFQVSLVPISPLPDKFVFKVMPLSQCTYLGGGTKARICPTTLADSKWRPVPLKRDGCLIPNLIGTYLYGAKNGKKTCYRIFDCGEMGIEVLELTIT